MNHDEESEEEGGVLVLRSALIQPGVPGLPGSEHGAPFVKITKSNVASISICPLPENGYGHSVTIHSETASISAAASALPTVMKPWGSTA